MSTALLFEGDAVAEIDDWDERLPKLGRSSVLWIDLERPDDGELDRLVDVLELDVTTESLDPASGPRFTDLEDQIQVTASAPNGSRQLVHVTCLVSERWVATVHDEPLEVLETFRDRASGSGATGDLEGPEFLANLLEWVFESYFDAFEDIEQTLEEIDARSMSGEVSSREDALQQLLETRREIGRLRRALTAHRETILALTRPELEAISSSSSAARFVALRDRLEAAVQAARDAREAAVGSFDVLIASTGQRTNEIMKILTLVSALILPGSLIAGIMGMNFKLGLFDNEAFFWVVLAVIALLAIATIVVARVRDWV